MLRDTSVMIGVLLSLLAFSAVILASVRLFFYLLERFAQRGVDRGGDSQTVNRRVGTDARGMEAED